MLLSRTAGCRAPKLVRPGQTCVRDSTIQAALATGDWPHQRILPSVSDTVVVMVGAADGWAGVLKVAASRSGVASLHRERAVLQQLRSDERLAARRALLPVPLQAGEVDGGSYLLTSRLPGRDGRELPLVTADQATAAVFDAITPFHRLSQTVRTVDDSLLGQWVNDPAQRLSTAVRWNSAIDRLVTRLRASLAGRRVTLGLSHGDFAPANVLLDGGGQVTGIVDWGQMREQDLVELDLVFWLLTVPSPVTHRDFGRRVAARLGRDHCWTPAESHLLSTVGTTDAIAGQALLLLAWLRHVADKLTKSGRADGLLWLRRNVAPVLRQVADG